MTVCANHCFHTLTLPKGKTAHPGDNLSLSVAVYPQDPFSCHWYLDDQPISDNAEYGGSRTATLTIKECLSKHKGHYKCVITDDSPNSTTSYNTELNLGMFDY